MTKTHSGWVTFAGIMLFILGVLNVIYGIAAIGDSKFFIQDQKYILSNLNTWGWVSLILGALQLGAAFSLWAGNLYGRFAAILAATLSAVGRAPVDPGVSVLVARDLRSRHHHHLSGRDVRRRRLRGRADSRDQARGAKGPRDLEDQAAKAGRSFDIQLLPGADSQSTPRWVRTRGGCTHQPKSGVHPVGRRPPGWDALLDEWCGSADRAL